MSDEFFGTYTPRMDDKGRITLPARYRSDFTSGVVVMQGQDHCLYLLTPQGFSEHAETAINASITDPRARGYQRYMLANTDKQEPDSQGRITIPARMRSYARLTKDISVVGVGRRMEIWDTAEWTAYEAAQEAAYSAPETTLFTS